MERPEITNAVKQLKVNLRSVARVFEWAELMGYENPKRFSENSCGITAYVRKK